MPDHNTLLNSLTDEELLRHFEAEHDPLTSTPITDELAKRFGALLDLERNKFVEVLDEFDVDNELALKSLLESHPASIVEMGMLLSLLSEHDIHDRPQLEKLIEFSDKFRALASDAGDVFTKLNELITTSQE